MKREEAVLLGITAIWGSTFPIMKISLENTAPVLFLAYRFGIASVLMLLIFRGRVLKRDTLKEGFVLGLTLFFGHGFQIIGLEYTTPSNSGFITSLYVVFTPFIAYFLLGETINRRDITSLLTALTGLYMISGANARVSYGDLLTVMCAVSFAFQIVLVERFGEKDYLSLAFWQIFWNFLLSAVYAAFFEGFSIPTDPTPILGALYTGIFATVLAFTLQMRYQRSVKAYKAALIYSLEPIFGHLASFAMLGEVLNPTGYLGAILILGGVWSEISRD
ncbi:permease [Thermococcus profundus]|uniref:Permease n=1 Tax=Thermococcus profundus TaxID=49899 RepID=A0A2Z2MI73_THEPR|nr:DMT family transporter [Thermococcus profundus]ASJ03614.1 permease [Thermococcus profundus]